MITHSILHHVILKYLIEKGYAPEVDDLCHLLHEEKDNVVTALYALQDYHGVVLHPHAPKIWVIHPFSTAPTNFIVRSAKGSWWGNCAWCSLGVAALLHEDVTITTSFGAHGESVEIHISEGVVLESDLLIHFPIPMREAWDNVIYTCSTMLVFKDQEEISLWCNQHRIHKGDVQPISKVWEFAQIWYGRHRDPDWKKWTMQEAQEIFHQCGLNHPVWQLEDSSSRF